MCEGYKKASLLFTEDDMVKNNVTLRLLSFHSVLENPRKNALML